MVESDNRLLCYLQTELQMYVRFNLLALDDTM